MDLNDKIAIVTGSARGIGRAIADRMAAYGATVVISDLRIEDVQRTVSELRADHPEATFDVAEVDVTQSESAEGLANQVVETHGQIDILVNNAGIIGAPGWESRDRSSEDDWDQIYAVNVKGVAKVSDAVAEYMKPRRYGKIVNIASVAGRQGGPGNTPYCVSKAGVISLTQAYALGLAPHNINVNAICPGSLWTHMYNRILTRAKNLDDSLGDSTTREIFDRSVRDRMPLGREQTPEDIGNLAVFLASDLSLNITGQSINVSGGAHMH